MEWCDIYDQRGALTGRAVARGTELPQGEYYHTVQVWIRNERGEYLAQQRAPHLLSAPGMWATTAGYVLAGEESIGGALREVDEELGLQLSLDCLKRFDRLFMGHLMQDIWIALVSRDTVGNPTPGPEVSAWKWATKAEIAQMIEHGEFFAYSYFKMLPE
jgi:8-oxo-dGTP pyrophosphatase MutT (NUDIX family)